MKKLFVLSLALSLSLPVFSQNVTTTENDILRDAAKLMDFGYVRQGLDGDALVYRLKRKGLFNDIFIESKADDGSVEHGFQNLELLARSIGAGLVQSIDVDHSALNKRGIGGRLAGMMDSYPQGAVKVLITGEKNPLNLTEFWQKLKIQAEIIENSPEQPEDERDERSHD